MGIEKLNTEYIHFRLLVTPCCESMLCWVNPRFPTFCPECGKGIYPEIKGCVTQQDTNARIIYSGEINRRA